MLDVIEKKVDQSKAEGETKNFIKELFCGKMINYIRCTKVNFESVREETFYDIQLPVKGFKNIYESLKDYTQEEDLAGDNQYDTEKYGKQDAKKGIRFKKLPEILFFHLRRFEYDLEQDENAKVCCSHKDHAEVRVLPKHRHGRVHGRPGAEEAGMRLLADRYHGAHGQPVQQRPLHRLHQAGREAVVQVQRRGHL